MNFTITGTYLPNTMTTPFSAPNTPYVLTFTLPTTPDSVIPKSSDVWGLNAAVTLNGTNFPNSQAVFFDAAADGGFDVCLNQICTPHPNSPEIFWDIFTKPELLYSGTLSNPTLMAGAYSVGVGSSYTLTPEPSSLVPVGIAAMGLCALRRRKIWGSSRARTIPASKR